MRDRITLERPPTERSGAFNELTGAWIPLPAVWGHAEDVADRNSEETTDRTRKNVRRRKVTIRWQPAINTRMRLKVNAETVYFKIVNMADIGYRDAIQLQVEEYGS